MFFFFNHLIWSLNRQKTTLSETVKCELLYKKKLCIILENSDVNKVIDGNKLIGKYFYNNMINIQQRIDNILLHRCRNFLTIILTITKNNVRVLNSKPLKKLVIYSNQFLIYWRLRNYTRFIISSRPRHRTRKYLYFIEAHFLRNFFYVTYALCLSLIYLVWPVKNTNRYIEKQFIDNKH